jgi:hypothetical protein
LFLIWQLVCFHGLNENAPEPWFLMVHQPPVDDVHRQIFNDVEAVDLILSLLQMLWGFIRFAHGVWRTCSPPGRLVLLFKLAEGRLQLRVPNQKMLAEISLLPN